MLPQIYLDICRWEWESHFVLPPASFEFFLVTKYCGEKTTLLKFRMGSTDPESRFILKLYTFALYHHIPQLVGNKVMVAITFAVPKSLKAHPTGLI